MNPGPGLPSRTTPPTGAAPAARAAPAALLVAVALVAGALALRAPASTGLAAAAAGDADPAPALAYSAPLPLPVRVVRPFEAPTSEWGPGHRGVDLAAPPGAAVLAAADGTVAYSGRIVGTLVVAVTHADGTRTTYEPLAVTAVKVGQAVARGSPLGTVAPGHPGCAATPPDVCLHWGALRDGSYLDPLTLLTAPDVRLLTPVAGR